MRYADEVQELSRNVREAAKKGEVGKLQVLLEPRNRHLVDVADPSTLQVRCCGWEVQGWVLGAGW